VKGAPSNYCLVSTYVAYSRVQSAFHCNGIFFIRISLENHPTEAAALLMLFQLVTADRPLVLLLDGLDQLSADHRAHRLAWLPNSLPPNVYVVVSTLTDHPTFDVLSAMSAAAEGSSGRSGFVEVPPLGCSLALGLVHEWLKSAGRGLARHQLSIVSEALAACSFPLYITLVFEEVFQTCSVLCSCVVALNL
jgi:hypothetical protein